jgi:hypothetical protein
LPTKGIRVEQLQGDSARPERRPVDKGLRWGARVDVVDLEPELVAVEAKHSVEVLDKQVDLKEIHRERVEPPASGVQVGYNPFSGYPNCVSIVA